MRLFLPQLEGQQSHVLRSSTRRTLQIWFQLLQCSISRPVGCVARLRFPLIHLHSTLHRVLLCSSLIAETAVYGVPLISRVVVFVQGMLLARFALCVTCGLYALHVVCILDFISSRTPQEDADRLLDHLTSMAQRMTQQRRSKRPAKKRKFRR